MASVTWAHLAVHRDARGSVFEPLDEQALQTQRNLHVVINRPGAVRGNHYHARTTEFVSVTGPAQVHFRDGEQVRTVAVEAQHVICFRFPPGVAHSIENTGNTDQVLVAFSDRPHDRQAPDTIPCVLID